jgi:hypothetical protein
MPAACRLPSSKSWLRNSESQIIAARAFGVALLLLPI